MRAKCANCKKQDDDKRMIYDVSNDKYFCYQKCADTYWKNQQ